jgi:predicted P-loop ATPase
MKDFVSEFIDAMSAAGCAPAKSSDIKPGAKNELIRAANDKGKNKSLYYTFDIEGDKASGRWYSCKMDQGGNWFSKSDKKWTAEQKEEWQKKIDAEKAAHEQEILDTQESVALEAIKLWDAAKPAKDHPYLKKKKILASGARQIDDMLLIPMRDSNGKLWYLQTILPDGSKYNSFKVDGQWVKGGRKQGCYHGIVKKGASLTIICLCEGFATGGSIAKSCDHPVVVAFDSGNLKPVAKELRKKYKNARIIICSDNDQWTLKEPRPKELKNIKAKEIPGDDERWSEWRDQDLLTNPGREKAQQAAVSVGGFVIYPNIPPDDPDKGTDFNDLYLMSGSAAVKKNIADAAKPIEPVQQEEPPQYDKVPDYVLEEAYKQVGNIEAWSPEHREVTNPRKKEMMELDKYKIPKWFRSLQFKKDPNKDGTGGEIEKNSGRNTRIFIECVYDGLFKKNEFTDKIWVCRCPPWEDPDNFRPRPIIDTDIFNMASELETRGLTYNEKRTDSAIKAVAEMDRFHPCRDYFDGLVWDRVPRLATWLEKYLGCQEQNKEYLRVVGTLWMVAAARRIYQPGTKFDHMLVLEGEQDIGKSTTLRILSTFGKDLEDTYLCEDLSFHDIDKPNSITKLQGKLIVEFSELKGMDKTADAILKGWITTQVDEIVKKYESYPTKYPRQFVLAGTTNDDDWLRDSTGNRRYWPVRCLWANTKELKQVKDQLWAEAVHLHKEGMDIYIKDDDPVYELAKIEQKTRLVVDVWEDKVFAIVENRRFVSTSEVINLMNFNIQQTGDTEQKRVAGILRKLGWKNGQFPKVTGNHKRVWLNPKYYKKIDGQYVLIGDSSNQGLVAANGSRAREKEVSF